MNRITFIVLLLIAVGCVTTGRSSLAKLPRQKESKTPAVQVEMRNVMYHFTDHVAVHILQLHGLVLPTQRARLPVFDDVQSFMFAIHFAEIAISTDALSNGSSPQKSSRISSIIQYFSQLHGSSIVSMWPLKIPQPVLT